MRIKADYLVQALRNIMKLCYRYLNQGSYLADSCWMYRLKARYSNDEKWNQLEWSASNERIAYYPCVRHSDFKVTCGSVFIIFSAGLAVFRTRKRTTQCTPVEFESKKKKKKSSKNRPGKKEFRGCGCTCGAQWLLIVDNKKREGFGGRRKWMLKTYQNKIHLFLWSALNKRFSHYYIGSLKVDIAGRRRPFQYIQIVDKVGRFTGVVVW